MFEADDAGGLMPGDDIASNSAFERGKYIVINDAGRRFYISEIFPMGRRLYHFNVTRHILNEDGNLSLFI